VSTIGHWDAVALIKTASFAFVALFPIVNPIGDAPIFLSLTRKYPEAVRKALAAKVALYGFVLLACALLIGTEILAFFDISISMIQVAGGLVLASTGWGLLNRASETGEAPPGSAETAMEQAFYPLTLPLTVGPGCISVAITIGAHLRKKIGSGAFPAALFGMFLVCLLVWFFYSRASRMEKWLGRTGTNIVIRLSSFILFALGLQIAWNGLSSVLDEFLGHHAS
jgi:multiple antibiotic resistance protein